MKEVIAIFTELEIYTVHIHNVNIDGSVVTHTYSKFNDRFIIKVRDSYKELNIILSDKQEERINAHLKVTEQLKKVTKE